MPSNRTLLLVVVLAAAATGLTASEPNSPVPSGSAQTASPPPRYLGLDAYLHWDKLSYLEVGSRAQGWSTADPGGSNTDGSNTIATIASDGRLLFDQVGPGVVTFLRMQQERGAPWRLTVDGTSTVITPAELGAGSTALFPFPLSFNRAQTQGTSIIAAPIPYQQEARFASTAPNGNFYALFRKLALGEPLPNNDGAASRQVASLLDSAGTDIAPAGIPTVRGSIAGAAAGAVVPLAMLTGGRQIRAMKFRVPFDQKVRFGNSRLRMYWDGELAPSVDAPIKFLTGIGAGIYQPADRQLVRGLLANTTGDGRTYLEFNLYWPMPFSAEARIELIPDSELTGPVDWSIRHEPFTDPANWWGTFHANYIDIPRPEPGQDMNFLDFAGSGKLVGTVLNFTEVGRTLEGDPRIYIDGSRTPQIAITGTEEWGMGGDYWNVGHQTSLPMGGLPSATNNPAGADVDGAAEYRFLIADSIPFNERIVVDWEHGPVNDTPHRYRGTMLWYGRPTPTAMLTDEFAVGASGDRQYQLAAAYEYVPHSPLVTHSVQVSETPVSFSLQLGPDNAGAFLRRTLDSCVANQRANIFVDDQPAGTWYNAGGSRRTGPDGHLRCWRDDEFPLPPALTAAKTSINIRIEPVGGPWTAAGYQLHTFGTG